MTAGGPVGPTKLIEYCALDAVTGVGPSNVLEWLALTAYELLGGSPDGKKRMVIILRCHMCIFHYILPQFLLVTLDNQHMLL